MRVTSRKIALEVARIAEEKKGTDILVLDMKKQTILCDYFVLVGGKTRIQTKTIASAIMEGLKEFKLPVRMIQGLRQGSWILMDFGQVVVHVLAERERRFYDIEGLWNEAPVVYPPLDGKT